MFLNDFNRLLVEFEFFGSTLNGLRVVDGKSQILQPGLFI